MENDKNVIKDKSLETVSGGQAPELPATQLRSGKYDDMFSTPQGPGQKEFNFYDGKVVDPSYFITKTEESQNK